MRNYSWRQDSETPKNERTRLQDSSVKRLRYDPLAHFDVESTTVQVRYRSNKWWESAVLYQLLALATILSSTYLIASFQKHGHSVQPAPSEVNHPVSVRAHQGAAWSSVAEPFSTVDPESLGFIAIHRREASMPGPIFGSLLEQDIPLPTNSWCENLFLASTKGPNNKVFQLPYIIDTDTRGGTRQGLETHPAHVQANENIVVMTHESRNGLALEAVEKFDDQHQVSGDTNLALGRLSTVLEWSTTDQNTTNNGPFMSSAIVRGAPYTSMLYKSATPKITAERPIIFPPVIDNKENYTMQCGQDEGVFGPPMLVNTELRVHFDQSDFTWLIFVSQPTEFACWTRPDPSTADLPPGVVPTGRLGAFELRATKPMELGMVRIALGNNCTTGQNAEFCGGLHKPHNQTDYMNLLRAHVDAYPTGKADVRFTFPVYSEDEEELRLNFNWEPALMSQISEDYGQSDDDVSKFNQVPIAPGPGNLGRPPVELLMYAIPHHQERMQPTLESSNKVHHVGCMPTIHGMACPVTGGQWSMIEHLHRVNFQAPRAPRKDMLEDIRSALQTDIHFSPPDNYMRGAGDTYFSGKILAKLARIIVIADEVGGVSPVDFSNAVGRLRAGVEIWLNGSAESPLLYDRTWGGIVMCGCDYGVDDVTHRGYCRNKFPDCPALVDAGQNFGAGFYNDHHFHFGYHIYSAAVVAMFDPAWGRKYHEHVLLLCRDITNPSPKDPYFPTWRHKDWYVGFSWASGVVTILGEPYPNGRNSESSSESIFAYEAVALYGDVMAQIYENDPVSDTVARMRYDSAIRMRDLSRLLMATEVRSSRTYWHVQAPDTPGVPRIYPEVYSAKVVGMIWSMMVQEQTWFGREPWKSFGIQLLPLTPIAELRDTQSWVEEMLPQFEGSCMSDPTCEEQGWSVLVFASYATIGKWEMAWKGVSALKDDVFETAGGNGHSRTNTLWYIATRPDYYPTATNPNTTTTIDNTNTIPATPTASPSSTRYPTKYDYKKWMPTQPPSPTTL